MSRRIDTGSAPVDDLDITGTADNAAELQRLKTIRRDPLYLGKTGDDYLTRLMKYIPAELIALYLTMNSMVEPKTNWTAYWITFVIVFGLVPIFYWRTTKMKGKPTLWSQILLSSIAFPLWVFAIGGPFREFDKWYDGHQWIAGWSVALFTVTAGSYRT